MASRLSIRRAQVQVVTDTCKWCKNTQNVNWYCNDCQEALCDTCIEFHQRAGKTKNDKVVPIKDADIHYKGVLPEVCKIHSGKTCDLYCCDCKVVMCAICFTQTHVQHTFRPFEEEVDTQKKFVVDQLKTLKLQLNHCNGNLSRRHEASKTFKESVDVIRQTIEKRKLELKQEIDLLAESVFLELSSLVEEEEKSHKQDCQSFERSVKEIRKLICDLEQEMKYRSGTCTSLFELTEQLRSIVPVCDDTETSKLHHPPNFVPGRLNIDQLKAMIGTLRVAILKNADIGYERVEIDNQMVQSISTFKVLQLGSILSICPVDNTHAWMIVNESHELIRVNKEGNVKESVKLYFKPRCLALTNSTDLLITCQANSALIHKLSVDRRVTKFADISPFQSWGISVSDSDEVVVSTLSPTILVLDTSGKIFRRISCEGDGQSIACLTTGNIAVTTTYGTELIIINSFDQITRAWSGELDNGQKIKKTCQWGIASDRYNRVFVPDYTTNQVYVLAENEGKARRFLGKKHGVKRPMVVGVDRCGHVWIGCDDGRVHVMQLQGSKATSPSAATEDISLITKM